MQQQSERVDFIQTKKKESVLVVGDLFFCYGMRHRRDVIAQLGVVLR